MGERCWTASAVHCAVQVPLKYLVDGAQRHARLAGTCPGAHTHSPLIPLHLCLPSRLQTLLDGTSIQLQASDGKWVAAEGGGGSQLAANRAAASAWETFFIRRTEEGSFFIRSGTGHYWSVDDVTRDIVVSK